MSGHLRPVPGLKRFLWEGGLRLQASPARGRRGRKAWRLPVTENEPSSISQIPLGTDSSRGHGCHFQPEAETAGVLALGQTQAVSRPQGRPGRGCSQVLSTPGFQRGSPHTPPEYLSLPGQVPNTRWPSIPSLNHETPSASALSRPSPSPMLREPQLSSPVSRPCPPGSPSYSCSLPPAATSPARRQGPAYSTPTPSPRLSRLPG